MKKIIYTLIFLSFASLSNAQWVQMSSGMGSDTKVYAFASIGSSLFAGTEGGIYKSINNGTNWIQIALNNKQVFCLMTIGSNFFAGTAGSGLYLSTNNGTSWTQTALINKNVYCIATLGNNIFAGVNDYSNISVRGVYRSTNYGTNWTQTTLNNGAVVSLATLGNNIFAGTDKYSIYSGAVFLSTNNGTSWTQTTFNNKAVWSLAALGDNIFAGTYDYQNSPIGVFITTNSGTNWTQTALNNKNVLSFATLGSNIIAGTFDYTNPSGVYLSTNNGATWINKNQGFNVLPSVRAFLITSNYIFAGTDINSVWRRPLAEIIGIQTISKEIPSTYSLSQNYPNPFNPTTNIRFDIPKSGSVKLVVFDALGREVATLMNEVLKPGIYETDWNGSNFTSGVYFYKLETGEFSDVKKMLLVK